MTKETQDSALIQRSLFGRRKGRPLTGIRAQAIETALPKLQIEQNLLSQNYTLDPAHLFNFTPKAIVLEIGFGQGERLSQESLQCPKTAFLGAEPFLNGMAAFLSEIKEEQNNIRVLMDDGMILARSLRENSIDTLYVLNPDPWHKTRHHKRRIINQDNLDIFARILKPGGMLVLTTDVPYLAEWMVTQTALHPAFAWTAQSRKDWHNAPPGWIQTRYETKGAKGAKKMVYMIFKKT